jgi:large subunit ribosomal protein L2
MIKKYKPTSPGIRFRKTLVKGVEDVRPEKSLTTSNKGPKGRGRGRISARHQQRGAKKLYRKIDFKRDKIGVPAKVASIENDPNRGSNIALLNYLDGEKRYILAPEGLEKGMMVESSESAPLKPGNCLPLSNIPLGMEIHNIEVNPGAGGKLVRGAGNGAMIMAKEGNHVNIKLPSGETKRILGVCKATIGVLSNMDLRNTQAGKAGRKRHLGNRPAVRGVAMPDPGKHPHAGSYKDTGVGMPSPKSPWGWKTRGVKTRKRKKTDYTIVTDRHKAKKKR